MIGPFQEKHFQEQHFRLLQVVAAVDDEIEHERAHDAGQSSHVFSDNPRSNLVKENAGIGADEGFNNAGNNDDRAE